MAIAWSAARNGNRVVDFDAERQDRFGKLTNDDCLAVVAGSLRVRSCPTVMSVITSYAAGTKKIQTHRE